MEDKKERRNERYIGKIGIVKWAFNKAFEETQFKVEDEPVLRENLEFLALNKVLDENERKRHTNKIGKLLKIIQNFALGLKTI